MGALWLSFLLPPCVYIFHPRPRDNCHLAYRTGGIKWVKARANSLRCHWDALKTGLQPKRRAFTIRSAHRQFRDWKELKDIRKANAYHALESSLPCWPFLHLRNPRSWGYSPGKEAPWTLTESPLYRRGSGWSTGRKLLHTSVSGPGPLLTYTHTHIGQSPKFQYSSIAIIFHIQDCSLVYFIHKTA